MSIQIIIRKLRQIWRGKYPTGGMESGETMNAKPLLDFIAKHEADPRLGYNSVWGKIKSEDRPKKPLTEMTISEVLAWQDSIDRKYMSEAAGRYQIMEDTLRGLYLPAGLGLGDLFNEENQDKLCIALLRRRGLHQFLIGNLSVNRFCNQIAKEWASMPVVTRVRRGKRTLQPGQSYYAGDGLNKAHAEVEEFKAVVRELRE